MDGKDFYLSLLSNASSKDYPENKANSFKVNLSQQLRFDGDGWRVALTDFIYPHTLYNVTDKSNTISLTYIQHVVNEQKKENLKMVKTFKMKIPLCFCNTLEDLLKVINHNWNQNFGGTLFSETLTSTQHVTLFPDTISQLAVRFKQTQKPPTPAASSSKSKPPQNTAANPKPTFGHQPKPSILEELLATVQFLSVTSSTANVMVGNFSPSSTRIPRETSDNSGSSTSSSSSSSEQMNPTLQINKYLSYECSQFVVDFNEKADDVYIATMEGRLALQCGFTPEHNILDYFRSPLPGGANLGIPSELFCYVDIIEPQLISDTCSQVIKIVKTIDAKTKFGDTIHREISNRNYVKLSKNRFQVVECELRDTTGELLNFAYGSSLLQLHFKRFSTRD